MELLCYENSCIADEHHMSLRSAHLEIAYEKILGQLRQVLDSERTRLVRVERLLLEADNEGLHMQLKHVEEELSRVTETESNVRQELFGACSEIADLQGALRANSQEIEDLKKQIASLNSNSLESKKILTEKLSLSKELSSLQRELERLRAQSTSYQTLLSEKLALERQLNSLEAKLETERRAFERAQTKDAKQKEENVKIDAQLRDLRDEVAKEIRERQRLERENDELKNEWESQRTVLENKLEALKKKLRSTKDRLKDAQNELQQRHSFVRKEGGNESGQRVLGVPIQRATGRFDPDMTIATPGAVQVTVKPKRSSALPGDKSTFSITPFLSRTSGAPDSPMSSSDDVDCRQITEASHESDNVAAVGGSPDEQSINHQPRDPRKSITDVAWDLEGWKQDARVDRMSTKVKPAEVSELSDNENQSLDVNGSLTELSAVGRAKPRKRKLLGTQRDRTLFDDEDDTLGGRRQGRKPTLRTGRNLVPDGPQLAATSASLRPGIRRGFGVSTEFSPLKRDRR
ncbi:hypothetical protein VTN00DRAFT_4575 [Thermoascus crustaceus]|uniref:uncharacterized protein n=1 Tax=Thermoascus crustaceus TaxID=5088 RepID=UPI0037426A9A